MWTAFYTGLLLRAEVVIFANTDKCFFCKYLTDNQEKKEVSGDGEKKENATGESKASKMSPKYLQGEN